MCYKGNLKMPLRFIPTDNYDIFKARESVYYLRNFLSLQPGNKLL